jgi:hypothetical protein
MAKAGQVVSVLKPYRGEYIKQVAEVRVEEGN